MHIKNENLHNTKIIIDHKASNLTIISQMSNNPQPQHVNTSSKRDCMGMEKHVKIVCKRLYIRRGIPW